MSGWLPWAAAALPLLAANVVSFAMMGVDKRRAKRKQYRISERALMIAAACFGAPGGMLGMMVFRHKTRHLKFAVGIPLLLAAQVIIVVWLAQWALG